MEQLLEQLQFALFSLILSDPSPFQINVQNSEASKASGTYQDSEQCQGAKTTSGNNDGGKAREEEEKGEEEEEEGEKKTHAKDEQGKITQSINKDLCSISMNEEVSVDFIFAFVIHSKTPL